MAGYLDNVRIAAGKRLRALQSAMEDEGLDLIMLFEGDLIAYKIALTSHFNIVLVANDDIYVVSDPTLYHEAVGETPWNVILVENLTPDELAGEITGILGERRADRRLVIGVNRAWGRTRLTFLNVDLVERLQAQAVEVVDATRLLAEC